MYGDFFVYQEHRIHEMSERLEDYILNEPHEYSDETIAEFKKGLEYLKLAYVYAHRIDCLYSGDDSETSFHKRLKEDLTCISCCSEISQTKCHSCGKISLVQITESAK